MLGQSIRQNAIGLSIFAVITAGIIAVTQLETKERITENIKRAKAKALYQILPPDTHNNELLDDTVLVSDPGLVSDEGAAEAYIARNDGQVVAVILPAVAPDGYTGKIHSIVGINSDGSIAGVRVLTHQETPGLGDKIEVKKSDWIHQFTNKSANQPAADQWAVKKDGGQFDQLTGATITPRAVVKSVHRALTYFNDHRDILLQPAEPGTQPTPDSASR